MDNNKYTLPLLTLSHI